MAKRFTDTKKWDKKWFRELGSVLRDVRQFILDRCDHAGIWEIDLDTVKHFTGQKISLADIRKAFRGEVFQLDDEKLFIPAFIDFQYGELHEDSRPHQSVIKELKKQTLPNHTQTLWEQYRKGYLTIKDKEQEQDKEMEQEKEKGESEGKTELSPVKLVALWNDLAPPDFSVVEKLTDSRRVKANCQITKSPKLEHWASVINRWKQSEFCKSKWRPTFDDLLNENKRIATLEGRYDNRNVGSEETPGDWEARTIREMQGRKKAREVAL